jgi:hypothetical protein
VNFSTQTHDFDPGFGPPVNAAGDRLFWTAEIPDSAVQVNFAAGRAEMHVHDLPIEDYFTFPNASIPGEEVDATVSFHVVWAAPVSRRYNVTDAANGFAGSFVENQATITWSASNEEGFTFVADPGSFATSVPEAGPIALLGHERNGAFFPGGSSAPEEAATPRGGKSLLGGEASFPSLPGGSGGGRSEIFIGIPPSPAETRAGESKQSPPRETDGTSDGQLTSDAYFAELAREGGQPWGTTQLGRLPRARRG